MSTHAGIGKLQADGSVKAIYCHHDGYPSYVGEILKFVYNNDKIVDKLIELGDISVLGEKGIGPKENEEHSFEHPIDGITVAYHRDRGEDKRIRQFGSEEDYLENGPDRLDSFYLYLFKNNEWYIADIKYDDRSNCKFELLK